METTDANGQLFAQKHRFGFYRAGLFHLSRARVMDPVASSTESALTQISASDI